MKNEKKKKTKNRRASHRHCNEIVYTLYSTEYRLPGILWNMGSCVYIFKGKGREYFMLNQTVYIIIL